MNVDVTSEISDVPERAGTSRRTILRGAAMTAWAVPTVALVTAAPAFAVSSDLKITDFAAHYADDNSATTADPTQLVVTAQIGNTGTAVTVGALVTLTIPGDLYASAPQATTPAGFGDATISGDLATGWTLTFAATAQVPNGGSVAFNTVLTFTDPGDAWTDAPFRRWAGNSFNLAATATATNASTGAGNATVAATPVGGWSTSSASIAMNSGTGDTARCTVGDFWNTGRSSTGQVTLQVRINKNGGGSVWANQPNPTPGAVDGKWTFVNHDFSNDVWKYNFRSKVTGYAPGYVAGGAFDGPGATGVNAFYCEIYRVYKAGNINNKLGARGFTISAPRTTTATINL